MSLGHRLTIKMSGAMASASLAVTIVVVASMSSGHPLFSWAALRGLIPLLCILFIAAKFQPVGLADKYRIATFLMDGVSWAALTFALALEGPTVFVSLAACIALMTASALLLRASLRVHIAFAAPVTLATVAALLLRADTLSITLVSTVLLYLATTILLVRLGQITRTSSDAPLQEGHAMSTTHYPSTPTANRAEFHFQDGFKLVAGLQQELRRPLHAILGMVVLAKGEVLHENVTLRHRLDSLSQCSKDMLSLIEDAYDLCLFEADEFKPDITEFDLDELIRSVHTEFEAFASGRQLLIINLLAGQTTVTGDATRLRRLLLKVLVHVEQVHPSRTIALEVWRMPNLDIVEFEIESFAGTLRSKVPHQPNLTETRRNEPASIPLCDDTNHGIALANSIARSLGGCLEPRVDLDVLSYLPHLKASMTATSC
jgi:signal transduction histidine kinase